MASTPNNVFPLAAWYANLKNSDFFVDGNECVHNIRKQMRPKISPLKPNPDYLSMLSQDLRHGNKKYSNASGPSHRFYLLKNKNINKIPCQRQQKNNEINDYSLPTSFQGDPTTQVNISSLDTSFNANKNYFFKKITKIDEEIRNVESDVENLRKKQHELVEATKKPSVKIKEPALELKFYNNFQKILLENKQKANEAYDIFTALGPKVDFPYYNQPSDTESYHQNKENFVLFRKKLIIRLKKTEENRKYRQKTIVDNYLNLAAKWKMRIERIMKSSRHKKKESKKREYFEKVFPELQPAFPARERSNRNPDRAKSEAEFQEILFKLKIEHIQEKVLKSCVAIPPIMLDNELRNRFFVNNNNLIKDIESDIREKKLLNLWTPAEQEIFKKKFIQHPKDFSFIASSLDQKSVNDCIKFYYLSKKTENYKQLLCKPKQDQ